MNTSERVIKSEKVRYENSFKVNCTSLVISLDHIRLDEAIEDLYTCTDVHLFHVAQSNVTAYWCLYCHATWQLAKKESPSSSDTTRFHAQRAVPKRGSLDAAAGACSFRIAVDG